MVRVRLLSVLVAALAALPLSGCLDGGPGGSVVMASGLFDFTPIERGDPGAVPVTDCASLEDVLRQRALDQARISLDQGVRADHGGWWGWGLGDDVRGVALESADAAAGASVAENSYSASNAQVTGTNNQEQAADEADLVKTDGEWTYVFSAGILHVLRSTTVGSLTEVAAIPFGNAWGGGELLLERRDPSDPGDDRLLLVLPGQSPPEDQPLAQQAVGKGVAADSMYWGGNGMTRIVVLSLADRTDPRIEHEAWIEGHPSGTRLVDGAAHVVVQTWEQPLGLRTWVGPTDEDLRPFNLSYARYAALSDEARREVREAVALRIDEENLRLLGEADLQQQLPTVLGTQFGFLIPEPVSDETCRSVLSLPQATGRSFTTILSLGLADAALPTKTLQVLGGSAIVYADAGALVLASPSQDAWWFWAQPDLEEATDLLWFDLAGIDVTPRASGRVLGTVLDSFSLDVQGDELRVATTVGQWGRGWLGGQVAPMVSQLVVFHAEAGTLVPRGSVGGIAPGERIWSARFTDDRAYLVTFRNIDPLWVIDLGEDVRILGELEIPGVSTYLHPLDDQTLLAIGYGPGPTGDGLDWNSVEVSLFDLSDLAHPRRADVLDLTPLAGHSWSGAAQEHRAFTYWAAIGTLAVPVSTTVSYEVPTADPAYCCETRTEQHIGLTLIDVDVAGLDLSVRGDVDQDHLTTPNGWAPGIERSWFMGYPETGGPVSVYSMSVLGVTSHDLASLQRQATVAFPQPQQTYYG